MAKTATKVAKADDAIGTAEFVCPECGKSFTRAAALGSHRRRTHGVAGSSKTTSTSGRGRARAGAATNGRINRDQLLQTLFPDGVPPREDVLRAANSWLDEAERLAGLK